MQDPTLLPPGHGGSHGGKDGGTGTSFFTQLGDESRLGRGLPVYSKVRLLGRGAFGKAYLVKAVRPSGQSGGAPTPSHHQVLKKLAVKGISEAQREAAFREGMLMRKISRGCPFITQFSDVFGLGENLCIVMEFCSGGDLRGAIRQREGQYFPEEVVLSWTSQVALALKHCHVNEVLHRDVKPENCFFRAAAGDLLLGDFGISCQMDERSFAKTCIGSPMYLSPEIVNQEPYSYTTDVWSLGVMLYEMAMLEAPFKGANICQLAFKICGAEPAPLRNDGCSEPLRRLVGRLLEKDKAQRATLDEALLHPPLMAFAQEASSRHGLSWPPPTLASVLSASASAGGGLVQRMRGRVANAACEEHYEDDFELPDHSDDEEDAAYANDFEALSADGSDPEYASDFEAEDELNGLHEVRAQLLNEYGADGLAHAENLGVVKFLEDVQRKGASSH
mmetsp:Transcript_8162/g.20472  ORF Transcript_8162/g.20472 Transcript_8162/m.20472 type:complete len:448 (+) Transcript_8162:79-1422(+)